MIAEDFCRLRVLGSLKHSHAYGGASMCAQTAKRPARARPAQFVPGTTFEYFETIEKKQTTFEISMSGLVQYAGWAREPGSFRLLSLTAQFGNRSRGE